MLISTINIMQTTLCNDEIYKISEQMDFMTLKQFYLTCKRFSKLRSDSRFNKLIQDEYQIDKIVNILLSNDQCDYLINGNEYVNGGEEMNVDHHSIAFMQRHGFWDGSSKWISKFSVMETFCGSEPDLTILNHVFPKVPKVNHLELKYNTIYADVLSIEDVRKITRYLLVNTKLDWRKLTPKNVLHGIE